MIQVKKNIQIHFLINYNELLNIDSIFLLKGYFISFSFQNELDEQH